MRYSVIMDEIWKPSQSYPGLSASSLGRIMVDPYESAMPYGGVRVYGGKPTFGSWAEQDKRFITVVKSKTANSKTLRVARVVCDAFHGPAPSGAVCMHLDENSRNNRPENLAWGTQRENLNAPGFRARNRSRTPLLTEDDVRAIRSSEDRPCDLARAYGVKPCTISNIKAGRMRVSVSE